MTDCHRADTRDLLPDWVNGSLEGEAAVQVAEHLTTCTVCAEEADLLRRLRAALSVEPPIDVRRLAANVAARTTMSGKREMGNGKRIRIPHVSRTSTGGGREGRRRSWPVVAGGLAVAASLIFGALLIQRDGDRAADAELPVAGGLADLGEDQLEALLVRLDDIEALPQTSTAPAIITTFAVK